MTLPEPDTHCWDEDTGQDVWSYSKPLVEQMLAERDAVLRLALEALEFTNLGGRRPDTPQIIAGIRKVLEP